MKFYFTATGSAPQIVDNLGPVKVTKTTSNAITIQLDWDRIDDTIDHFQVGKHAW